MVNSIQILFENGKDVFLLIHEGKQDLWLANEIKKQIDQKLPIVSESDPLKITWIIGESESVISSRYHGLVSAFSQGVPALGTGWNHKYEMLFKDYSFEKGLLELSIDSQLLLKKLQKLINSKEHQELKKRISNKAEIERKKSEKMWELVWEKIE
jgi:colanic acid/amylovoran biosynthesis protein